MFLQKCEISTEHVANDYVELRLTAVADPQVIYALRTALDRLVYQSNAGQLMESALRQTIDQQVDDLNENEEIYRFIDGDVNTDTEWFEESIGRSVSVTKKDGDYWAGYFVDDGLPFADVHKKRLEKCDDG